MDYKAWLRTPPVSGQLCLVARVSAYGRCDCSFFYSTGESWGHASTIRIVLYWDDNQRYNRQSDRTNYRKNQYFTVWVFKNSSKFAWGYRHHMLTSHVLWNEYVTIAVNLSLSNCEIALCFCPRTIPEYSDNKPWAYICSEGFFCWAYFRGSLFSKGLIIGTNFAFQTGLGLTIKTAEQHYENSLKQLKTASTNSPWACILEGLLSEGFLRLRFEGLIFGAGRGGGGLFWEELIIGILRYFKKSNRIAMNS